MNEGDDFHTEFSKSTHYCNNPVLISKLMKTILIVEDERDLADLLAFNLEKEGFKPLITTNGSEGFAVACRDHPDLILLDIMLPGMLGTEVCRELRKRPDTAEIPIIMLTAKGEEIDRVVGFELGADDYLVKPFSTRELLLRIRAILRRAQPLKISPDSSVIHISGIIIDPERCTVTTSEGEISLTTTEYKLLIYLVERPGRVQSRELLLQNVWGYNYLGDTRTVDTHMTRLRSKLGDAGEAIVTVRGFGYKLEIL